MKTYLNIALTSMQCLYNAPHTKPDILTSRHKVHLARPRPQRWRWLNARRMTANSLANPDRTNGMNGYIRQSEAWPPVLPWLQFVAGEPRRAVCRPRGVDRACQVLPSALQSPILVVPASHASLPTMFTENTTGNVDH